MAPDLQKKKAWRHSPGRWRMFRHQRNWLLVGEKNLHQSLRTYQVYKNVLLDIERAPLAREEKFTKIKLEQCWEYNKKERFTALLGIANNLVFYLYTVSYSKVKYCQFHTVKKWCLNWYLGLLLISLSWEESYTQIFKSLINYLK